MSYKLATLTAFDVASLKDVRIKNIEKTEVDGKPLNLIEAYNAAKALSDDWKKDNADAERIDTLLLQYLESVDFFKKSGIEKATIAPAKKEDKPKPTTTTPTPSVPTPQKSQKDILAAKIKTFETAWKYAKGDEKNKLAAKIKTFQTALKYAK